MADTTSLKAKATQLAARGKRLKSRFDETHAGRMVARYGQENGNVLAGGIAYYSLVSIAAGLVIGATVVSFLAQYVPGVRSGFFKVLNNALPGVVGSGSDCVGFARHHAGDHRDGSGRSVCVAAGCQPCHSLHRRPARQRRHDARARRGQPHSGQVARLPGSAGILGDRPGRPGRAGGCLERGTLARGTHRRRHAPASGCCGCRRWWWASSSTCCLSRWRSWCSGMSAPHGDGCGPCCLSPRS